MSEISPLRRRMIEDMTVRNLSPATQRSYVYAVARFGRFFNRSPKLLGLEEARTFQVHLVAGSISWSALNQTVCAVRFLYGVTLRQADLPERIPYARTPRKLPVVLGSDEWCARSSLPVCALSSDQVGDQRIDLVAPHQPLAGNFVEAGTHAVELQFAHGFQDLMAFHHATFRRLS